MVKLELEVLSYKRPHGLLLNSRAAPPLNQSWAKPWTGSRGITQVLGSHLSRGVTIQ